MAERIEKKVSGANHNRKKPFTSIEEQWDSSETVIKHWKNRSDSTTEICERGMMKSEIE